jgi:hypothetical protein
VDKQGAFANIQRMIKPAGRLVISHPMGKAFIDTLKKSISFPLDDFPAKREAKKMMAAFGFDLQKFVDEPELYILVAKKQPV